MKWNLKLKTVTHQSNVFVLAQFFLNNVFLLFSERSTVNARTKN